MNQMLDQISFHKHFKGSVTNISYSYFALQGKPELNYLYMYYLKHEHECFIRYKTRGAAERFISDKARIASVLNSFKNDPFYTH